MTHMYAKLNDRVEQNKFIGNAQIEFIHQFDPAAADRYAQHRKDFYARREEEERAEALARQAEREGQILRGGDDMPPLRSGRISAFMNASIEYLGHGGTGHEQNFDFRTIPAFVEQIAGTQHLDFPADKLVLKLFPFRLFHAAGDGGRLNTCLPKQRSNLFRMLY